MVGVIFKHCIRRPQGAPHDCGYSTASIQHGRQLQHPDVCVRVRMCMQRPLPSVSEFLWNVPSPDYRGLTARTACNDFASRHLHGKVCQPLVGQHSGGEFVAGKEAESPESRRT
ncbi:hypothetical protein C0Q70_10490 [Pomacea canaliculata]|uniref:Uncharacterized protein n=1 Tax=Pomacea canaliculata TaxID=400727 RepID=A0A2T7P3A8_POMCA|nr:hypothetical protein C0Q70_10490 [Pomacea canaliculata]